MQWQCFPNECCETARHVDCVQNLAPKHRNTECHYFTAVLNYQLEPGSISSKKKIKTEQQQAVCIREANKLLSAINDTFQQTAY